MNEQCVQLNASIYPKSGNLYAVIRYRYNGQRHIKWRKLCLKENASREEMHSRFVDVVQRFKTSELMPMLKGESHLERKHQKEPPRAWTVIQAAEYLSVSEKTVYTMLKAGILNGVKVKGRWHIPNRSVYELENNGNEQKRGCLQ